MRGVFQMTFPLKAALIGLSVAAVMPAAKAADLAAPRILAAPVLEEDYSSGWYVRGDLLGNFGRDGAMIFRPNGGAQQNFGNGNFDAAWGAALGIGLKYKWLRTDFTADYRLPTNFAANTFVGNVPGGAIATTERARFDSNTFMWNVYADLGTWSSITPYVGAGIGVSRIGLTGVTSTAAGTGVLTPRADNVGDRWGFAYAAMAGVSVEITQRLSADLGYRFISFGQASFTGATGTLDTGNLYGHEVRFGLRYMIF